MPRRVPGAPALGVGGGAEEALQGGFQLGEEDEVVGPGVGDAVAAAAGGW